MDSETIYEAAGEVVQVGLIERKGGKVSIDEGFEGHPDEEEMLSMQHPLFNHEMTDEAVARSIFNYCDLGKTGLVRASALVDLLLNYASENNEIRETFEDLLFALDPNKTDPEITFEDFQSSLRCCIRRLTCNSSEETDWILDLSQQHEFKSESCQLVNPVATVAEVMNLKSPSSSALGDHLDVKELHFQFSRIQEENSLLQEQMADVEETNIYLRSENSILKTKINRMEQSVTEYGQESSTLQETNSHLQGRIAQLKDDLQKMTVHYDKCQKELDKKILELEKVHAIRIKDEEHCNHLIETIKQLEEIILQKEGELLEKDKEIQKIAQDLMEQQLLLDPVITNELGARHGQEAVENLAAELQSSLSDTPWKKQMDNVLKPDFIHPAAWNAMLNEPEYEDEPNRTSPTDNESIPCAERISLFNTTNRELVHSTPTSKIAKTPICWTEDRVTSVKEAEVSSVSRRFLRALLLASLVLTVLIAVVSVIGLVLLVFVTVSACGSNPYYHQQTSPYYSSPFMSKVFDIIKPYCRIEYEGCPPI